MYRSVLYAHQIVFAKHYFFIYYTPINIFVVIFHIDNVQLCRCAWMWHSKRARITASFVSRIEMHRTQNSWSLSSNFITRYHVNNIPTYAHTHAQSNTFSDVVNFVPAIIGFARTWLQLLIPMLLFDYDLYVDGFGFHFGIKTFNTFIVSFRSMLFFRVCFVSIYFDFWEIVLFLSLSIHRLSAGLRLSCSDLLLWPANTLDGHF